MSSHGFEILSGMKEALGTPTSLKFHVLRFGRNVLYMSHLRCRYGSILNFLATYSKFLDKYQEAFNYFKNRVSPWNDV